LCLKSNGTEFFESRWRPLDGVELRGSPGPARAPFFGNLFGSLHPATQIQYRDFFVKRLPDDLPFFTPEQAAIPESAIKVAPQGRPKKRRKIPPKVDVVAQRATTVSTGARCLRERRTSNATHHPMRNMERASPTFVAALSSKTLANTPQTRFFSARRANQHSVYRGRRPNLR